MRKFVQVALVAIGLPLVAVAVIAAANTRLESDWLSAVVAEFGPQPGEVIEQVRLSVVCSSPVAGDVGDPCLYSNLAHGLVIAGLVASGLAAVLILSLIPLRRGTSRDPRVLAYFRTALVLFLIGLTIMVLLDGAVVAGAAYLAETIYTGSVHPFVAFGIGAAVVVAGFGVLKATVTLGRVRPMRIAAIPLERNRDANLYSVVDALAADVGTAPPDRILAGLDPTFFVTESPIDGLPGPKHARTLFLSVPLMRVFDRNELSAVIGHELGHFKGEDTLYSRRFYPVYGAAVESYAILRASANGLSGIPLLAPLGMLSLFFEAFVPRHRALSRQRELAADAVGSQVVSTAAMGTALIKLEAYLPSWLASREEVRGAIQRRQPPPDLSKRFAELAALNARSSRLSDVDQGRIPHPTDTHPPTSERLKALGVDKDAIVASATTLPPAAPAIDLIDDGDALELDLMDDLVEANGLPDDLGPSPADLPVDPSEALRTAALQDPAIASAIALFERVRGHDLLPAFIAGPWLLLADLEVRRDPAPRLFASLDTVPTIPSGAQVFASAVASGATPRDVRIPAGTPIELIGISLPDERRAGRTELLFDLGGRVLAIRTVGDWPIDQQVAGLFVAPKSDVLAGPDSLLSDELASVVDGLVAAREGRMSTPTPAIGIPATD